MCNPCGYPSLDLRARADISAASLNMADDARRGTSIHGQEAQLHLSRMYTFRQAMSLQDAVHFAIAHPRKEGNFSSKLVHSKFWDTTIGMLESWLLLSKSLIAGFALLTIVRESIYFLDQEESMYASMSLLCISLKNASISQLPDMSRRRFLINDVLSVTASMQTQETEWDDSDQAFNQQIPVVANFNHNRST